jgi:hexosaminidase
MKNESIIPRPKNITPAPGYFSLTSETAIIADQPNHLNAQYLKNRFSPATGYPFRIFRDYGIPGIHLKIQQNLDDFAEEGYYLAVTPQGITITSSTTHGIFNGLQSLIQLLPPEIELSTRQQGIVWQVPCLHISDAPRFSWRGFMLDEGRHFHGRETVLDLLDWMASLKMNIFHWHLTEDQGWRIQIQAYPRLTEIGSQRAGTAQHLWNIVRGQHDRIPHSGFYTQDQIREIVAYATERHITVIPEIEIPGHSMAALAAYPEYSCNGGPFEVPTRFGIFKDIYCPGKEATFIFLKNILDEIIDLFPGPYIHIGGDEAPKTRWKACPDCQRRILKENLADEHTLQTYFSNRIADDLAVQGRKIIGWNESLSDTLKPDALIQYWTGNRKGLLEAIRAGRQTIISSYLDYYLDHSYSLTPLRRIYEFEPIFDELSPSEAENIIGVEAPLWTEFVPNRARLDFQTFPRLLTVAETGWTPKNLKDFNSFQTRLADYQRRLDIHGVAYARIDDVQPTWFKRIFGLFTIVQPQRKITEQMNS